MKRISLFTLNTGYCQVFKKLKDFLNLKSVGWGCREEIKVTPMRVCQPHHYQWVDLDVKLEASGVFIKKANKPVKCQSLLIPLFRDDHTFVDALFLCLIYPELLY